MEIKKITYKEVRQKIGKIFQMFLNDQYMGVFKYIGEEENRQEIFGIFSCISDCARLFKKDTNTKINED